MTVTVVVGVVLVSGGLLKKFMPSVFGNIQQMITGATGNAAIADGGTLPIDPNGAGGTSGNTISAGFGVNGAPGSGSGASAPGNGLPQLVGGNQAPGNPIADGGTITPDPNGHAPSGGNQ